MEEEEEAEGRPSRGSHLYRATIPPELPTSNLSSTHERSEISPSHIDVKVLEEEEEEEEEEEASAGDTEVEEEEDAVGEARDAGVAVAIVFAFCPAETTSPHLSPTLQLTSFLPPSAVGTPPFSRSST